VAELSRLLTSGRGERRLSYLNRPDLLAAYLRCFLPWNVYRLSRLLPALPLDGVSGVTDLGSGPLTLPISLWIARPDLRGRRIDFLCADRSGPALEAGKKLFAALNSAWPAPAGARTEARAGQPWLIRTLRGDIHDLRPSPGASLITAVQVFNESGEASPADREALGRRAEREARFLAGLAPPGAGILVMEPGTPQPAAFIAELRGALLRRGRPPLAPCPHGGDCPFPGGPLRGEKQKWCHFAFDTEDAPPALRRLSASAGLPKERAVLSFLYAGGVAPEGPDSPAPDFPVRILSDSFPVKSAGPPLRGRYACSSAGAALVTGSPRRMDSLPSGTLLRLPPQPARRRDPKSGALLLPLEEGRS
jgi:hypothetical protein